MKMQFIVTGWHYNQEDYINGLIELKNDNDYIDVFWSCHKDPPKIIKDNFNWKLFPNLGMADGGYQQAIEYLKLEDETICFFTNDDIIIKDWGFITLCINRLSTFKVLGNCTNYPTVFDPMQLDPTSGKRFKECAKPETRSLFNKKIMIKTVRSSFFCIKYKDLVLIKGFEPIFHFPELIEPKIRKDGKAYIEGYKGIGGIGNLILNLCSYKLNVVFGGDKIGYLGDRYLDSNYIYECARGSVDPNNPMK